ncbi:fibrinogen C domain-containing protein 1-B-like [Dysidea avara]|uniref:fibrinogen C domain-containing protein 1-B-like n=1 Tax=Dysidea avara TaxID=196820 RepID=UPI00332C61D1
MINTVLITILSLGVVVVVADALCISNCVIGDDCLIENCCELGYGKLKFRHTFKKPEVYSIKNFCGNCKTVVNGFCDTLTAGGGWLVIQRRQDGSVDFNRDWVDYEDGFGSLIGEFWYGLRAIHCLTNRGQWELRIDYTFTNETKGYLSYSNFRIGPATEQYPLTISGFDGVTTNPFSYINGMKFTTRDRDNDLCNDNCAVQGHGGNAGGWWYACCSIIHLNHQYNHNQTIRFYNMWYPLPFIEIKMRSKNCII